MKHDPSLPLLVLLALTIGPACAAHAPPRRHARIAPPARPVATVHASPPPTLHPHAEDLDRERDHERDRAASYFDDGVAAYAQGDFARAILAFERAYTAAAAPEVLFNLARAHDSLGHDAPAAGYYAAFLRDALDARAADRIAAQTALGRLTPRVGWLRVRGFGAFTVDGTRPPGADPEAPVAVAPGARAVRLAGIGSVGIVARAGETVQLDAGGDGVMFVVSTAPAGEAILARRPLASLP